MRKIHLANEKRRDAEVGLETTGAKKTARYALPSGAWTCSFRVTS